jgi:hypothetical protein
MSSLTLEIQVPPDRTVTFHVPDEVQARQVKITIEPVELEEAGVTLTSTSLFHCSTAPIQPWN